uniref:Uncharacterized protein n=1 Tax=viral metagenome TaxID=1070528 RepID=A0A6H1ZBK4_9ZZZZ
MEDRELKQERSVPVQSRVDIKTLAEMDIYWESIGVRVRSMSQLVSWTVDLCRSILVANDKLPMILESSADGNNRLEERGLYQRRMRERAAKKIHASLMFENLRFEGIEPKDRTPMHYNVVHNERSVEPFTGRVKTPGSGQFEEEARRMTEKALKIYEEKKESERKEESDREWQKIVERNPNGKRFDERGKEILVDVKEEVKEEIPVSGKARKEYFKKKLEEDTEDSKRLAEMDMTAPNSRVVKLEGVK